MGVVGYILQASEADVDADVHAVHQPHEHQHISLSVKVHERGVAKLIVGGVICLGTPHPPPHILVTERSGDRQVTAPWNIAALSVSHRTAILVCSTSLMMLCHIHSNCDYVCSS